MYLSQVSLRNFRLFRRLDLDLNPGLNVLVGENDSGKTTMIDAIRYVLGTNSNDRAYIAEQDFFDDETNIEIKLKFSDIDNQAYWFVEHITQEEFRDEDGNKKYRSVLYVQLTAQKTGMERRGYPYIRTEVRSGIEGNGLSLDSDVRDFLAVTYLKPLRDAASELSPGKASRLSQILSSSKTVKDGADALLAIVAEANASLLQDDAPLRVAAEEIQDRYLHELLFESDKGRLGAFIDIAGVKGVDIAELPENVKRRHLRAVLEGLRLALSEDRRLHGLGYHNLLFIAAELLLLAQEAENENSLLLIEEPEAHLHPQLQMKLLEFISSQSKTPTNPSGVQCIVTTHSPNISSKVDPSAIIMLSGGGAWSLRPGETELVHDDYRYLRKFLDVTKANVFFARSVIFVEGDGEHILLPELAKLLGRPFENFGVSVVKYDNSGSWKRFAKLFLRTGKDDDQADWFPVKICALRDLDLWPDCAEKKADNQYGFKERSEGNLGYWLSECDDVEQRKTDLIDGLQRQNVRVKISDDWTFEYCLAKHGLIEECCDAIRTSHPRFVNPHGDIEAQATCILKSVGKTDFAYDLVKVLQALQEAKVAQAIDALPEDQRENSLEKERATVDAKAEFAEELKAKLPPYIVDAIECATDNEPAAEPPVEEDQNAAPA